MAASSAANAYQRISAAKTPFVSRGDKFLVNTYHALAAPSGATPGSETAEKLIAYVASPEGQRVIAEYGRDTFDEGLYNDAAYAKQYDH